MVSPIAVTSVYQSHREDLLMTSDQPYAAEGYALMGAAFEVHNVLGGGLLEEVYQQSLEIELGLRGVPFRRKQECKVFY
jgi:hypothetical protein